MAIKVSAKTVAQLRKGTMAGNLAKAKNASPEMKEALVRFYGAKRVNAAGGAATSKASVKTPSAKQTGGMTVKSKSAPSAATRMDKPKAKATANVVDQVKALRKAQAESARLDNATRAQLIEQLTNWVKALTQA
jgi:hypothetical protein